MKNEEEPIEEEPNFGNIDKVIEKIVKGGLDKYFTENLPSYISSAQRISSYFGSLRIKYLTFNFTLVALFASILAVYTSSVININLSLLCTGSPLLVGLIIYFIIVACGIRPRTTTGFDHRGLLHYSCLFPNEEYPNVTPVNLKEFTALFKELKENVLIKNDIKTLIMQYFHQANHNKIGKKLRKHLIWGIYILFFAVLVTFIFLLVKIPTLPA